MRSTMINRHEGGTFAGNSNGELKRFGMTRPYRGVPITIKVPTHVDVKVFETSYLYSDNGILRELKLRVPDRSVEIETIETDKVFVVDVKRPLSGTLAYKLTFGDDQYVDEISGKLEDTTIKDVASLVATAIPLFAKSAAGEVDPTKDIGKELITNKRIVAYKRFDIDACDYEMQLKAFLEEHVNCGHTCAGNAYHSTGGHIDPILNSVEYHTSTANSGSASPSPGGQ